MLNFIGGMVLGGGLGAIAAALLLAWLFVAGRISHQWIADACDRLIDATNEPDDEPTRRSTLS